MLILNRRVAMIFHLINNRLETSHLIILLYNVNLDPLLSLRDKKKQSQKNKSTNNKCLIEGYWLHLSNISHLLFVYQTNLDV
jgi:hypothetical protein